MGKNTLPCSKVGSQISKIWFNWLIRSIVSGENELSNIEEVNEYMMKLITLNLWLSTEKMIIHETSIFQLKLCQK